MAFLPHRFLEEFMTGLVNLEEGTGSKMWHYKELVMKESD